MYRLTINLLFSLYCIISCLQLSAQKGNYEQIAEFPPPHFEENDKITDSKYTINGLKLSNSGKYLIVDHGYKNSLIAIYDIDSVKLVYTHQLETVADFNNTYFSKDEKLLYVKSNRFSSEYKAINIQTNTIRSVTCDKTPNGCVTRPEAENTVEMYSPDRKYYFVRNKLDKSTLHICKIQE